MSSDRPAASETVPADFVSHRLGRRRTLIRQGFEAYRDVLSGEVVPADARWVGGGRAAHPVVSVDVGGGEQALVRTYLRGGFIRHFNRARYLFGHRAFAELTATERARMGGVNVPVVLAAAERAEAWGYTATLATLWIGGMTHALDHLSRGGAVRDRALSLIGSQIGRMHRAGIAHPDLNLNNVLIDEGRTQAVLLDFDHAGIYPGSAPADARVRNLRRLARSARRFGVAFDSGDWKILRDAYGADWPLGETRL